MKPSELHKLLKRAKPYVADYVRSMEDDLSGWDANRDRDYDKWLRAEKKKEKQVLRDMG